MWTGKAGKELSMDVCAAQAPDFLTIQAIKNNLELLLICTHNKYSTRQKF